MRQTPPPPPHKQILTGHYRRGKGYSGWRERGTDDWLLILTLDGYGRFGHSESEEFLSYPGDLVLLRPGTRHDYGIARGSPVWELLWTHFYPRTEWSELLRWHQKATGLFWLSLPKDEAAERTVQRLKEVHRLATSDLPKKDFFAMNALEEVLLHCTSFIPEDDPHPEPRVRAVTEMIQEHFKQKISLDDLAKRCGLSVSRMSQVFRRHTGLTPVQYLEEQRMSRAKQLLTRTSLSVSAIATEVGFDNPFYFTLRFKRFAGLPPSQWRRKEEERSG
jgi:AraC family transcriptional regulator of arabinose operon